MAFLSEDQGELWGFLQIYGPAQFMAFVSEGQREIFGVACRSTGPTHPLRPSSPARSRRHPSSSPCTTSSTSWRPRPPKSWRILPPERRSEGSFQELLKSCPQVCATINEIGSELNRRLIWMLMYLTCLASLPSML